LAAPQCSGPPARSFDQLDATAGQPSPSSCSTRNRRIATTVAPARIRVTPSSIEATPPKLDAERRADRFADQADVVYGGAARSETGAGLDEVRAAIENQLGDGDLFGLGQTPISTMTLKGSDTAAPPS